MHYVKQEEPGQIRVDLFVGCPELVHIGLRCRWTRQLDLYHENTVTERFLTKPNKSMYSQFPPRARQEDCNNSVSDPDPHSICLPDPDPAADEISSKSQKNSYYLKLLTNLKKNYLTYLNFRDKIYKKNLI
jgi:hypothetical protein